MCERTEKLTDKLYDFMSNGYKFIVYDLETNGFHGSSVLSISAVKVEVKRGGKVSIVDMYDRYYYSKEKYNEKAIAVNNLSEAVVSIKRGEKVYPEHFDRDEFSFVSFCKDANGFIGHNIEGFDNTFFNMLKFDNVLDTMLQNKGIVTKEWNDYRKDFKWPNLKETAEYYGITVNETKQHNSMYDVQLTTKVFEKMIEHNKIIVR